MPREIIIEIGKDGVVRADVSGVKGPGCKQYLEELRELLGLELSFEPSSEYYEASQDEDVDIHNKYN